MRRSVCIGNVCVARLVSSEKTETTIYQISAGTSGAGTVSNASPWLTQMLTVQLLASFGIAVAAEGDILSLNRRCIFLSAKRSSVVGNALLTCLSVRELHISATVPLSLVKIATSQFLSKPASLIYKAAGLTNVDAAMGVGPPLQNLNTISSPAKSLDVLGVENSSIQRQNGKSTSLFAALSSATGVDSSSLPKTS